MWALRSTEGSNPSLSAFAAVLRPPLAALVLLALAGCGEDRRPAADTAPAVPQPVRGDLHPKITGARLLEIQRVGDNDAT